MAISRKLNLTDNNWYSCKYEISVDIIFSDGTTKTLKPVQIIGIYMEKDYDNDHLPILMLDVSISKVDKNKVNRDTQFHIRMNQFYLRNNDDSQEKKSKKIYLNDTFVRLDSDVVITTDNKIEKTIRKSDGMSDDDLSINDMTSQTTFVLVKKSDLELSKKIVNGVLINVDQSTLVKYSLTKSNCPKKVLMSNIVNKTTYNEFILQPKPLLQQLIYLENEYGWYPEGTYIFIDYDTFFIIRKNGRISAWRKNETTSVCFCISDVASEDTSASGVIVNDNMIYINIGTDQYRKVDGTDIDDQISGSNVLLFNTTTGKTESIDSRVGGLDGIGAYNTKMYHGRNSYLKNQYSLRKQENKSIWDITCTSGDVSFFTPNKQFTFISDVSEVSDIMRGNHRVSSLKANFIKNGNYFDTTSTIRLKKVE